MSETDSLQLIDLPLIARILDADDQDLWLIVLDHLDTLNGLDTLSSQFALTISDGMHIFREAFFVSLAANRDAVVQGLINDLGFIAENIPLDYWSRYGYLDDPSSARVKTSRDLIPEWDATSGAAWLYRVFDVLEADHIALIAETTKKHFSPDDHATFYNMVMIDKVERSCREDPTRRAAYIYNMGRG